MQNLSNHSTLSLDDIEFDEFERVGIPSFVYLAILCVTGIIGNLTVLITYSKNYEASSYKTFVLCLAAIDFLACTFCIPIKMYRIRNPYTVQSSAFCKISKAAIYFTGACSLALLDVIAVERYKQVCRATREFTVRTASIVCLAVIAFMLIVFAPLVLAFDIKSTDKQYPSQKGYECRIIEEYKHYTFSKVYLGVIFFMFMLLFMLCLVLYSIIGRTLFKRRNRYQTAGKAISVFNCCFWIIKNDDGDQYHKLHDHNSRQEIEMSGRNLREVSNENGISYIGGGQSTINESSADVLADDVGQNSIELSFNESKDFTVEAIRDGWSSNEADATFEVNKNKTIMFLIVSVISFGSYLPFLIFAFIHIGDMGWYMTFKINYRAVHLFIECIFYLNNAINPLVYVFIDRNFQRLLH